MSDYRLSEQQRQSALASAQALREHLRARGALDANARRLAWFTDQELAAELRRRGASR